MSIASMTGFGAGSASEAGEELAVELKSVNGKFCEVKARLPRELASLEPLVVRAVKDRLSRGTVDVAVRRSGAHATAPRVNVEALTAAAGALREAARQAGLDERLGLAELLQVPGLVTLEERPPDVAAAERALTAALATGLDGLVAVRRREGAALETDLRARVATLRELRARVVAEAPASVTAFRDRLHARIHELAPELAIDPGRLEQEVVIFADRTDVAEELTRLGAHLDELERLLGGDAPVGRQLEFLLQELHREVNTTGSKAQSPEMSRVVVAMKAEVERLREQVANVE